MNDSIYQIGDYLRAHPTRLVDLSPEQLAMVVEAFRPDDRYGFSSDQMQWIRKWWLDCTDTELQGITATNGRRYVCADLLSDALEGRRLAHLLPTLETLVLTFEPEFPEPEEEID